MAEPAGHVLDREDLLQQIHYLSGIHSEAGRDRHAVVKRRGEEEASAVANELQGGGFAEVLLAIVVYLRRHEGHDRGAPSARLLAHASRTTPVIVASAALTASYSFSEQDTSIDPAAVQRDQIWIQRWNSAIEALIRA